MGESQQLVQDSTPPPRPQPQHETDKHPPKTENWNKPTLSGLEADLSYFTARLEFIKDPVTINQRMQVNIFNALVKYTTKILNNLR
ncbi:hypothetical protein TI05_00355 [Achromatium sp. WMS3]|nr:hypothetical protein TI05_00355 [Achromatium sp. WMS3]